MPTTQRTPAATAKGTVLPNKKKELVAVKPMPLPGVVIFVHGVNSEGEWFEAAEAGLCKGLNRRLARLDDQMAHKGPEAGQLTPVSYIESLTPDGYINPNMASQTYIKLDPSYSPVIHFRWGYKANKDDLKKYGGNVFLNEQNYWGGGPFANGCSSLPDLWNKGINDRLFLMLTIQALNPVDARQVYATPERHYGVMAALRLAKLIESIRKKQADCPITVVCHSQGNIVGLAAAFLGDRMPPVKDAKGKQGECVADAYVLANPPYSVVGELGTDNWAQRGIQNIYGEHGRESYFARMATLKEFFDIIRWRPRCEMDPAEIDKEMANSRPSAKGKPFSAEADRQAHGVSGGAKKFTSGRVTLYCCPHDQVISATTVQGIGWRGLSSTEIEEAGGVGVLVQRVFASGFTIGKDANQVYRYWEDDWRYQKGATPGFWFPPSPPIKLSFARALGKYKSLGRFLDFRFRDGIHIVDFFGKKFPVNANPPKGWTVPCNAPKLDQPFEPVAMKHGYPIQAVKDGDKAVSFFNEGNDPPASDRDMYKTAVNKRGGDAIDQYAGAAPAEGNAASEAGLRYEMHAIVRQTARREQDADGPMFGPSGSVISETPGYKTADDRTRYANSTVKACLESTEKNNPTNHSITMTNPMHAEKALAYDVAIGVCRLTSQDWADLRIEADWRFSSSVSQTTPSKKYSEYFSKGTMSNTPLDAWVKSDPDAAMPKRISDERDGSWVLDVSRFL